jgi:hypothetical protein
MIKSQVLDFESQYGGRSNQVRRFINFVLKGGITPPPSPPYGPNDPLKL